MKKRIILIPVLVIFVILALLALGNLKNSNEIIKGEITHYNCVNRGVPCSKKPHLVTIDGDSYSIDNYAESKLDDLIGKHVIVEGKVRKNKGYSGIPPSFVYTISVESLEVQP